MEKIKITIDGENIEINVQIKKIKHIYFQVKNNNIILKLPKKLNIRKMNELIEKNKNWILKNYDKITKINNKYFVFLGENYDIYFKDNIDIEYIINEDEKSVYISNKLKQKFTNIESIKDYILYKEAVKRLDSIFYEMVMYTNLKPSKLAIKNLKSVWRKLQK